jgi:hypothetical protein
MLPIIGTREAAVGAKSATANQLRLIEGTRFKRSKSGPGSGSTKKLGGDSPKALPNVVGLVQGAGPKPNLRDRLDQV